MPQLFLGFHLSCASGYRLTWPGNKQFEGYRNSIQLICTSERRIDHETERRPKQDTQITCQLKIRAQQQSPFKMTDKVSFVRQMLSW